MAAAASSSWMCPITQVMMVDPVIGPDGHTYERTAIEAWLAVHATSPLTRQKMPPGSLIPNIALRHTIQEFLAGGGDASNRPEVSTGSGAHAGAGLHTAESGTHEHNTAEFSADVAVVPISPREMGPAGRGAVTFGVACQAVRQPDGSALAEICISPPADGPRMPCAVVCVLDISGSMGEAATLEKGKSEANGFSRLDLVKHSVATVIASLNDGDSLAIISFSDRAEQVLGLTLMTPAGKAAAAARLTLLEPDASTNLWDGLRLGLETASHAEGDVHKNTVMLVLTDGEANINPPRGVAPTLTRYLTENPLQCTIHTFGFGYRLDAPLLADIARMGNGNYSFIPDASMVGTIFINFLAYVQATAAKRVSVQVTIPTGVTAELLGVGGLSAELGTAQYGQSRNVIVAFAAPLPTVAPFGSVQVTVDGVVQEVTIDSLSGGQVVDVAYHFARAAVVQQVGAALVAGISSASSLAPAQAILAELVATLRTLPQDDRVGALIQDLCSEHDAEGQIGKSFAKKEWFAKWGRHYVPSVLRAHQLQVCMNFKDAGLQLYASDVFKRYQSRAETLFVSLPAPKPSRKEPPPTSKHHSLTSARTVSPVSAAVDMSDFYDYSGGCLYSGCPVAMADGTVKPVCSLVRGDAVLTHAGEANVVCIVKTPTEGGVAELYAVGGSLLLTAWHPVLLGNEWKFPIDVGTRAVVGTNAVYNVVLDSGHSVVVGGVTAVTLGHGFAGAVVSHPYLGTRAVVDDLSYMSGWVDGVVTLDGAATLRCPKTRQITRWVEEHHSSVAVRQAACSNSFTPSVGSIQPAAQIEWVGSEADS